MTQETDTERITKTNNLVAQTRMISFFQFVPIDT